MSNWFEVIPGNVFTYGEAICLAVTVIVVAAVVVVNGIYKIWESRK